MEDIKPIILLYCDSKTLETFCLADKNLSYIYDDDHFLVKNQLKLISTEKIESIRYFWYQKYR